MRRLKPLIVLAAVALGFVLWQQQQPTVAQTNAAATATANAVTTPTAPAEKTSALPAFLPAQARDTLDRIARGGPFEHRQDGGVFGNYERLLPQHPRGYYHEYTVETPGASTRGQRRIITGGNPPTAYYYTSDHYRSFRRFEVNP